MTLKSLLSTVSLALIIAGASATAQAQIAIGHLEDLSGGTADVGTPYGQGVADTFAWVNKNGGVGGKQLNVESNDYGYQVPRAIALYKKWSAPDNKVAAIMGWGTADTEALTGFLAQDKIPDISGSYAAALTDPEGTSGKAKPAPYNFFYGPSYSDAMRAMLMWAADDWKAKGKPGKPKFVHMGANHPYPNAPKAAGEALATELGFEVLPPLVFALTPWRLFEPVSQPEELGRQLRLSRQHRGLEHFGDEGLQGGQRRRAVPRQRLGHGRERGQDRGRRRRWRDLPAAHRRELGRQRARHEDGHGNLKNVGPDRQGLSPGALHRRRLLGIVSEGSARLGRQERRRHRRERRQGFLPEEGLGAGRYGRRLQSVDLDREGPSRKHEGRPLSRQGDRGRPTATSTT